MESGHPPGSWGMGTAGKGRTTPCMAQKGPGSFLGGLPHKERQLALSRGGVSLQHPLKLDENKLFKALSPDPPGWAAAPR